jgi:NTE family protein
MELPNIMKSFFQAVLLVFIVTGCSTQSVTINAPLKPGKSTRPQAQINKAKRSDELTLILTFSGGGTRAAALSYGVMEELRDTPITVNAKKRRMVDEVDLISSVSGGSFTAAYYGLFGDRLFHKYEQEFLKQQVQTALLKLWLLNPRNWVRLVPGLYTRSDIASEYYQNIIFKNKTFADLRPDAPHIMINATDLSLGTGFAFTDRYFNLLCSDLRTFPIGRAVAASSAVPVLFAPISLRNYAGNCHSGSVITKTGNSRIINNTQSDNRLIRQDLAIQEYRNAEKYPYLHLVDGGIVDNLGIRSLIGQVAYFDNNLWKLLKAYHLEKAKDIAFIVVNAANFKDPDIPRYPFPPTTAKVVSAVTTIQFDRYNNDTLELLKKNFSTWKQQIKQGRCREKPGKDCGTIDFHMVEVSLKQLSPEETRSVIHIPTSLELATKDVDVLKAIARKQLRGSPEFQRLLNKLK